MMVVILIMLMVHYVNNNNNNNNNLKHDNEARYIHWQFIYCIYIIIFFCSKLSVLVFHTSFKFTSQDLDCGSF